MKSERAAAADGDEKSRNQAIARGLVSVEQHRVPTVSGKDPEVLEPVPVGRNALGG